MMFSLGITCWVLLVNVVQGESSYTTVFVPGPVSLGCEFDDSSVTPRWYRYVGGNSQVREELWNGLQNRFFITGNRNAGVYNLFINATRENDTGLYSCTYGTSSTLNVTLTVLPTSWLPVCQKRPNEPSLAGDVIVVACSSTSSASTTLRWIRNDATMIASETSRNGTTTSIEHIEVVPSDVSITFTCEALVVGLEEPRSCILGPYPEDDSAFDAGALIPFIVVGILTVVVILLFFIVLYILFRHRQCRFCQARRPEPQMVLDADAIASGRGFPTVIVDEDDDDEDEHGVDGVDNSTLSENQPDLLTSITRTNLTQKSPNSTLRDNMERGKRGTVPSKKHSEIEKLRPSELRKMKKKRSPSASSRTSHVENADPVSPTGSVSREEIDPPSPVSVDQNETPRSATTTPNDSQTEQSQPSTSYDTGGSSINNLDASIGRKNKFTKRRDSKKSGPVTPSTSPRNITESSGSGSARQSDTVIYAELDFSKNVGMNILGDERL